MLNATHIPMDGAREYRKIATVKAVQIHEDFIVETLEGVHSAKAGDYLCVGAAGERWPVKRGIFEQTYEPVPYEPVP